jgi:peptide deformylase
MMEILKPEEIEGKVCSPVTEEEAPIMIKQAEEMMKLCAEKGGVGLSAPQVGIFKRFFVWMISDRQFEIVMNPSFYPDSKTVTHTVEGCLTYPNEHYIIFSRYKRIRAIYYTFTGGKFVKITKPISTMKAIIWQHENMHLDGKTIRMYGEKLDDESQNKYQLKKEFIDGLKERLEKSEESKTKGQ